MGSLGPAEFGEDLPLPLPPLPDDLQGEVAFLTPEHFWITESASRTKGLSGILTTIRHCEEMYGPPAAWAAGTGLHQSFYRFLGAEVIQHAVLAVRRYPGIGKCYHLLFNELTHDPFEDEEKLCYLEFALHDQKPRGLMQSGKAIRTRSEAWLPPVLGTCALVHWDGVDKKFTIYRVAKNERPMLKSDQADLGTDLPGFRKKISEVLQLLTLDNWESQVKGYFV